MEVNTSGKFEVIITSTEFMNAENTEIIITAGP